MSRQCAMGLLSFSIFMIILFANFTDYHPPADVKAQFLFFTDVHVMIFVGFGFLMSFLHRGGFTATSHAFLVAAYTAVWALLNRGFWKRAIGAEEWSVITLTVEDLLNVDFCAGAVLISFGALLGRVSVGQLLVMAIIEVVVYCINEVVVMDTMGTIDAGGSYFLHMFGAFFGLACSYALDFKNTVRKETSSVAHGSTRVTDTMAMVGTLFLFVYWPTFNAAGLYGGESHDRALVNTYLSIAMSVIATFLVVIIIDPHHKIGMVEVQNSTLAGGVAMGAACGLVIGPGGALITGLISGTVSVLGYRGLTPKLESAIGLRDTCGVLNLHGIPSIIGAIVTAVGIAASETSSYQGTLGDVFSSSASRSFISQSGIQVAAIAVTLTFSIGGGLGTGFLLSKMPMLNLPSFFDDDHEYSAPDGEHTESSDHATSPSPIITSETEMDKVDHS